MDLPIALQHPVPNRHRRRARRPAPRRPYRAVFLVLALVAAIVWLSRALDRPLHAAAAGVQRVPAAIAGTSSPADGAQLGVPRLARGACWALPATGGDNGRTVYLDPGHGGPDPGASGNGVNEKDATLGVALKLAPLLRSAGWRVVLSRTADTSVAQLSVADVGSGAMTGSALHRDLMARVACANAGHADVLLSIHFNGFDDPSVGGTETFYDPDRAFSDRSLKLAQTLQGALVKGLGSDDRGVESDTHLEASTVTDAGAAYGHLVELGPASPGWVDVPSAMPGALVEPLFVTDPQEAAVAGSAAGQQRIAQALADGLRAYFG